MKFNKKPSDFIKFCGGDEIIGVKNKRELDSRFIDKTELKEKINKIDIYHKQKQCNSSIIKKPSEIIKEILELIK
jgi:hypothetical protein